MASSEPSSSSSSAYAHHTQNTGSLYSFSVHQPYTNWPLHTSQTTPYAPSWYALPTQQYGLQKAYREQATQTLQPGEDPALEYAANGKGKERDLDEPELRFAKQWDGALSMFLKRAGLYQALSGFRDDILLLNEDWERRQIPSALEALVKDISECTESDTSESLPKKSLEERKLSYVQSQNGVEVQTPSSTTKSISRLLKQSRKRNDASNRAEFLQTAAEKRRRLNGLGEAPLSSTMNPEDTAEKQNATGDADIEMPIVSCARVDAKTQDRDTQMKYDIAKNEDGPLKRTMKRAQASGDTSAKGLQSSLPVDRFGAREPNAERHPGLAERMGSIEDHLAVRFVPSHPRSLLDRLKFLEDYIVRLEKDFPPWAALHFNQPNRGWPPPPRLTPIIIPSHLATGDYSAGANTSSQSTASAHGRAVPSAANVVAGQTSSPKTAGGSKPKPAQSSLHRAVMEKLEIRRAMGDLAGGGTGSFGDDAQPT